MRTRLLLAPLLAGLPVLASAATFNVTTTADIVDANPGDGICSWSLVPQPPGIGVCSLRAALQEANFKSDFDTINLVGGQTYRLTVAGRDEDNGLTGDLDIKYHVRITAFLSNDLAVIDADELDRVFDIHSTVMGAGVQLFGLAITGGDPGQGGDGGGIRANATGLVSVVRADIYENRAVDGSALYQMLISGNLSLTLTNVFHNQSQTGGAVRSDSNGDLLIANSSVFDNSHAGIIKQQGAGAVRINNSTISGHISGVYGQNVNMEIFHSSLVDNNQGLEWFSNNPASHTLAFYNTILTSNSTWNCKITLLQEDLIQADWNVSSDNTCNPSGQGGANSLHGEPVYLSTLGNWGGPTLSHRPQTRSPVIDRTFADQCVDYEYDQRTEDRIVAYKGGSSLCDTGAVELETDVIFFDQYEYL